MRSRLDEQLTLLNTNLLEMGGLIEQAIARATEALTHKDVALARLVCDSDQVIDDKEKEIESICLKLILQQQPVASDLRLISSALKMITDMERIADAASDISEFSVYLVGQQTVPHYVHIPQMAEATIKMVTDSIDAYVRKDLALAKAVMTHDDVVDELFCRVRDSLIELIHEDVKYGEQAMDLLLIAKYFERIGDHAVNIAEWVKFSITGKHKNIQVL